MRTYQAGGSLDAQHPYYIQRQADRQLHDALLAGEFCSVLNARQMGKSSLMVQVMSRLQQEGIRCATIDMSRICGEGVTPEQFYKGMAIELTAGSCLSRNRSSSCTSRHWSSSRLMKL